MQRAWKLIKPYKKSILIISILSLLVAIAEIVKPYLVKVIMDDYLGAGIYQKGLRLLQKARYFVYCGRSSDGQRKDGQTLRL